MDVRAAFTDDEWKQVKDLPTLAAFLVMTSGGSGPAQMVIESTSAAKVIARSASHADPLVVAVVADLTKRDDTDKPAMPEDARSKEAFGASVVELARGVAALTAEKTPESARPYAEWVLGLARKVAEAAKEGSVLGIGGVRVSPEEEAGLGELSAALGV